MDFVKMREDIKAELDDAVGKRDEALLIFQTAESNHAAARNRVDRLYRLKLELENIPEVAEVVRKEDQDRLNGKV